MTHLELIEFIYTHRETLDSIYKGKKSSVDNALKESRLVTTIGEQVELSEHYKTFVDTTLNRIEYAVVFESYSGELQEILKQKRRYLEEQNPYYLEEILALLKAIFLKLNQRDQEIRILLIKIENETSLDLDLLIEKAKDILEKIEEVNQANNKVRQLFNDEIYELDLKTKQFIDDISPNMLTFIENISESLKRLKLFIARTRKLRRQNQKLHELANSILEEKTEALEELLKLEPKKHYLTLYRSQKTKVKTFPDASESARVVNKLRQHFKELAVKKEPKSFTIKPTKEEPLNLINIQIIEDELSKKGSQDIFNFIYQHPEVNNFIAKSKEPRSLKEESFRLYLQFVIPQNEKIRLTNDYNEHAIRIAQWR